MMQRWWFITQRQTTVSLDRNTKHPSYIPFSGLTGRARSCRAVFYNLGRDLLHSEVIGRQASVVDVENQAGIVSGGIEHLGEKKKVNKGERLFRLQTEDGGVAKKLLETFQILWERYSAYVNKHIFTLATHMHVMSV